MQRFLNKLFALINIHPYIALIENDALDGCCRLLGENTFHNFTNQEWQELKEMKRTLVHIACVYLVHLLFSSLR